MEYQALYRKYRPNTFDSVIGQEHITDILKNQIITGHTSHAYLFSGTRGTGKTSTAKILARAVNCLHPVDGEPCMECEACTVAADANVDVIELDAASNNGVDDMRSLIEKAVFAPVRMKKKVYIIDEAHMLSTSAFNALLKTLEEPPSHVMFILATTEPHKIIPTITSRCQRFDFRRLKSADIISRLKTVLKDAGAVIDSEGLSTIARKANGGMRDALSLADQCISFCGNNVTAEDVYHILGSADFDSVYSVCELLLNSDAKAAVEMLSDLVTGRDLPVLVQDITSHFRSLLLTKMCGDCTDILDCTDEDMRRLKEQAKDKSEERIIRALDILSGVQSQIKYYPQPRILVETAFVKICRPDFEDSETALLDRIDVLEKKLKDGIPVQVQQTAPAPVKLAEKPKEKKRIVQEDAYKVYKEINDALPEKVESIGSFIQSFFSQAVDVKLVGSDLQVYFRSIVHYEDAKDAKPKLDQVAQILGYDVHVVPMHEDVDEGDEIEKSLLASFDNIVFTD